MAVTLLRFALALFFDLEVATAVVEVMMIGSRMDRLASASLSNFDRFFTLFADVRHYTLLGLFSNPIIPYSDL